MARQLKISTLGSTTTIANGDILHVVVNPASTPVNRTITFAALANQLVAAKSLANTAQSNAQAQINAFSYVEVANSTTLEAGQSNDVLRFSNSVGIVLSTDGGANVIIGTANNTQEQRVRVANNYANVGFARPIINFITSGNTDNITVNINENISNDAIDVDISVPDHILNDLTDVEATSLANGGLLFYNGNTSVYNGTSYVSVDMLLPAATRYTVDYTAVSNTVTMSPLTGSDLPTAYALSGTTIAFTIPQDPAITFRITDSLDANVTEGISHVSVQGQYTEGTTDAANGTIYWNIKPDIAAGTYKYVISAKAGTVTKTGNLVVKDITSL